MRHKNGCRVHDRQLVNIVNHSHASILMNVYALMNIILYKDI